MGITGIVFNDLYKLYSCQSISMPLQRIFVLLSHPSISHTSIIGLTTCSTAKAMSKHKISIRQYYPLSPEFFSSFVTVLFSWLSDHHIPVWTSFPFPTEETDSSEMTLDSQLEPVCLVFLGQDSEHQYLSFKPILQFDLLFPLNRPLPCSHVDVNYRP